MFKQILQSIVNFFNVDVEKEEAKMSILNNALALAQADFTVMSESELVAILGGMQATQELLKVVIEGKCRCQFDKNCKMHKELQKGKITL